MDTTKENSIIKKEIKKMFPNYKNSVRQGSGTASGWKNIDIFTDIEAIRKEDGYGLIKEVSERFEEIRNKVTEIVRNNSEIGYFYADDGYDTKMEEFIIQVHGK